MPNAQPKLMSGAKSSAEANVSEGVSSTKYGTKMLIVLLNRVRPVRTRVRRSKNLRLRILLMPGMPLKPSWLPRNHVLPASRYEDYKQN